MPAVTLIRAPLDEGVSFPQVPLTIYGNADLFETVHATERERVRGLDRERSKAATGELSGGTHAPPLDRRCQLVASCTTRPFAAMRRPREEHQRQYAQLRGHSPNI